MKKTVLVLITFALVIAVAGCGFWLVHYFIDSKEQRETYETLGENPVMVTLSMVAAIFIGWPVSFGFTMTMLWLARDGKRPEVGGIGSALNGKYYLKCIGLYLLIGIFTFLWTLLLIIPGIIKSISYSMAPYILAENPEIGCLEAISRSQKMMYGYKWQYYSAFLRSLSDRCGSFHTTKSHIRNSIWR